MLGMCNTQKNKEWVREKNFKKNSSSSYSFCFIENETFFFSIEFFNIFKHSRHMYNVWIAAEEWRKWVLSTKYTGNLWRYPSIWDNLYTHEKWCKECRKFFTKKTPVESWMKYTFKRRIYIIEKTRENE